MSEQKRWIVVVPTIREQQLKEFLESFKDLFQQHVVTLIVVEDNPTKTFKVPELDIDFNIHVAWDDIEKHLKEDSWIIPRRTDCVRSFGFYLAHKLFNSPYVLTLDDDVRYNGVDIFAKYEHGFNSRISNAPMYDTLQLPSDVSPRGFPFKERGTVPVMLQWGMWEGVPDLDGVTQLLHSITDYKIPELYKERLIGISKSQGVTGCIMNCAFKREVIPAMYQLLMGQDKGGNAWPYDRWGDIWSGHLAKKYVENVLGGAVAINYAAHVRHERASNVYTNIKKELSGYEVNEYFWTNLSVYTNCSYEFMIKDICDHVRIFDKAPTTGASDKYKEAILTWLKILQQ